MGMNVKAIERKIAYLGKEGGKDQYMYVMQPLIYSKLTPEKVIQQAALHCGLTPAVMNVAYAALSEVIKAWATEGHSVAVPGLGTMRFGLRANAVKSVEDVSTKLITQRRVIFCPNMEIKQELAKTGISITCVNRDGEVVKNIASNDSKDVEDTEGGNQENPDENKGNTGATGGNTGDTGTQGGGSQTGGSQTGGSDTGDNGESGDNVNF